MRPKILRQVDEVNSELENSSANNRLNSVGSGIPSEQNPNAGSGGSSDPNHYNGRNNFPRHPMNKSSVN